MLRSRGSVFLFALLSCTCLNACGGDGNFQTVYPVKGVIQVDGKPVPDCLINFHRTVEDKSPQRVTPYAVTNDAGQFKLTSYKTDDGAPAGEYIVTIEWRERTGITKANLEGVDRLDGAYAKTDVTKKMPGFVVNVDKKAMELPPFQLKQSAEAKRKHEAWKASQKGGSPAFTIQQ